ncbi:hypothetical protein BDZ97DRAFT_1917737 [Flammula alnicola]|nr:hypothetical protein BDZ97DRAFT_1917737 [Flammula alnicola]
MARDSDDEAFLREIPYGVLMDFRQSMYTETYLEAPENAEKFMNNDWIDVKDLQRFLDTRKLPSKAVVAPSARVERDPDAFSTSDTVIKRERVASPELVIKKEPSFVTDLTSVKGSVKLRLHIENGIEVTEILSSDDEGDMDVDLPQPEFDTGMSSDTMIGDDLAISDKESDFGETNHGGFSSDIDILSEDGMSEEELQEADTVWLDSDVTSKVSHGSHQLNRQLRVDSVEYLSALPSYWPIPREKRAYVIDLSDEKYDIRDEDGKQISDQDSWRGGTGEGDSISTLAIFTGEPIPCRRSRLKCSGIHACEKADRELYQVKRYELDPESLQDVIRAQINSRLTEADSPAKLALIFFAVCHSNPCPAINSNGRRCDGAPAIRTKNSLRGKRHFIGCSGWSRTFSSGHSSASIPDNVKEEDIIALFEGRELESLQPATACSRIIPAHVGGQVKKCKFPHNADGRQLKMVHHECLASRTIYIPVDPSIRMACIVPNHEKPHTHPILPATKPSRELKELYKSCIQTAGLVGSSVRTIDNARSTLHILGKAPALVAPALQSTRVKQQMLRSEKKKKYPHGTGTEGVTHLMNEDLKKLPLEKRYIHGFKSTATGAAIIFTANPFLLGRIHKACTIQVDTTFKRAIGDLKEWEVVMWDPEVQRAVTIARVYSNRSDTLQYKMVFDELQVVTLQVTGKRLLLKSLSREGTIITIGVDLELSQALGAGLSFLPTNEPDFSGIPSNVTAEELIEYFIRACITHVKRGVKSLESEVTAEEYRRLLDFPYLKMQAEVDEFAAWIVSLKNLKVTAWWQHKIQNKWILPSIIKALSKIKPEDWDLTAASTNIGEGQHHWTNINTGIKLTLLEAVVTNDTYTRMSRNTTRASTASRKVRENRERNDALETVTQKIEDLEKIRRQNTAEIKALKEAKGDMKSNKSKSTKSQSNSSGKVRVSSVAAKKSRVKDASKAAAMKTTAAAKRRNKANLPDNEMDTSAEGCGSDAFHVDNGSSADGLSCIAVDLDESRSSSLVTMAGVMPAGTSDSSLPFMDITAATNICHQTSILFPSYDSYPSTSRLTLEDMPVVASSVQPPMAPSFAQPNDANLDMPLLPQNGFWDRLQMDSYNDNDFDSFLAMLSEDCN